MDVGELVVGNIAIVVSVGGIGLGAIAGSRVETAVGKALLVDAGVKVTAGSRVLVSIGVSVVLSSRIVSNNSRGSLIRKANITVIPTIEVIIRFLRLNALSSSFFDI